MADTPRDYIDFLEDILLSINLLKIYASKKSENIENTLLFNDALLMRLLIIGESVKKLPMEVREKYSEIPWRKIAGLRDFIAHQYFAIDENLIKNVIINDLPKLKIQVTK